MTRTEAPFRIRGVILPPPPPPVVQLSPMTVLSTDAFGNNLPGYRMSLSQSGVPIRSGFTPVTFDLTVGQVYEITPEDFGTFVFDRWSDGQTIRSKVVIAASTSPQLITAIFRSTIVPPPPPPVDCPFGFHYDINGVCVPDVGPPPPPPPPPPGPGVITSVSCLYWHYISVGGTSPFNNVYAEINYTASQLLMGTRCVMIIRDALTGAQVQTWNHDLVYSNPGKITDNLPMYRNLPTGMVPPQNLTLEFYFVNPLASSVKISPTITVSGVALNTFNGQRLPPEIPTALQPVTVRGIHYSYAPTTAVPIAYQFRGVATYRAHASIIGLGIRARMALHATPSPTPFVTTSYAAPGIPAAATGVLLLRTGTDAGLNPLSIDARIDAINAAGAPISNVFTQTVPQNSEYP